MSNKEIPYKIYLEENEMPDSWYNVRADMKKKPAPLLNAKKPEKKKQFSSDLPEQDTLIWLHMRSLITVR